MVERRVHHERVDVLDVDVSVSGTTGLFRAGIDRLAQVVARPKVLDPRGGGRSRIIPTPVSVSASLSPRQQTVRLYVGH